MRWAIWCIPPFDWTTVMFFPPFLAFGLQFYRSSKFSRKIMQTKEDFWFKQAKNENEVFKISGNLSGYRHDFISFGWCRFQGVASCFSSFQFIPDHRTAVAFCSWPHLFDSFDTSVFYEWIVFIIYLFTINPD